MKPLVPLLLLVAIVTAGAAIAQSEVVAPNEDPITLVAVGDISLARGINMAMVKRDDYTFPFQHVAGFLGDADIAVGNLEAQLFKRCPVRPDGMRICASDKAVEGLVFSGIDVVSVANNHAMNFGGQVLEKSVALLRKNGVAVAGYDRPAIVERKGKTFAFLAYDMTKDPIPYQKAAWQIRKAREKADYVILLMHWGKEYESETHKSQIEFAAFAAKKGASCIIGSHPHVVQPTETIGNTPVIYSLGNFIFDQETEPERTTKGTAALFQFKDGKVDPPTLIPIELIDEGIPTIKAPESS